MLFNSIEFGIFLPIVFILYWFVFYRSLKQQNFLILISSFIFYGWWDWRFLFLILFSTFVDFFVGRRLRNEKNESVRKGLLWLSIIVNLGFLGVFKYYNFFLENFVEAFSLMGKEISANSLNIILPVGISFYTFQTLSYTIDVYNKKLEPTSDFIAFGAFVSFFPQLVAGPIERAKQLLPQFYSKRTFDYGKAADGMRQILWGLFKKVVIADNCAELANQAFSNPVDMNGSSLAIGALFFTFQIYGDFSGYSDIAIGTSRLFGFNLMQNFAFPYFSRDIAEFWRRWHISLSTWFRDYLYIPLGGSRGGTASKIRNTFIIFLVSGFWHGANWTFIFWGFLNALFFLPLLLSTSNRRNLDVVAEGKVFPNIKDLSSVLLTFSLTVFAWIFFRAENLEHAFSYLNRIMSMSFFEFPTILSVKAIFVSIFIVAFLTIEWFNKGQQHGLNWSKENLKWFRYPLYLILIVSIFWFRGSSQEFIYFQF